MLLLPGRSDGGAGERAAGSELPMVRVTKKDSSNHDIVGNKSGIPRERLTCSKMTPGTRWKRIAPRASWGWNRKRGAATEEEARGIDKNKEKKAGASWFVGGNDKKFIRRSVRAGGVAIMGKKGGGKGRER